MNATISPQFVPVVPPSPQSKLSEWLEARMTWHLDQMKHYKRPDEMWLFHKDKHDAFAETLSYAKSLKL